MNKLVRTAVAAIAFGAVGLAWRELPVDARAATVDRGDVRAEASGTGTLESETEIALAFTTAGRIVTLAVDEGDAVTAGQLLGTLDLGETTKQLAVAKASESVATTSIARAKADLARARVARDAAKIELDRMTALVASGAGTGAQLDAAKERFDRAEAELTGANAAVSQAGAGSFLASTSLSAQARRLEDGQLVSPIDGVVLRRAHVAGDVVGSGATVLIVASLHKVRARAWIDETALALLREGGEARVVVRSEPARPLRGRIERIALEADRQTHEVLVDVELLERPARLAFGQRADVFLTTEIRPLVTRAPHGFCDPKTSSCLVERDGRVVRVPVTVGLVGESFVEIATGLSPGDVLLAPPKTAASLPLGKRVRRVPG